MPPSRVRRSAVKPAELPPIEAPAPIALPEPLGWWRILGLALSLASPAAGAGLALLYWKAEPARARRFSRWCLGLAVLGLLLFGSADAVEKGMAGGEWLIQPY